jgi:hypothetical protein
MWQPSSTQATRKNSAGNTRNCASACPNYRFLADAAGPIIDTSSQSAMHVTNKGHGHFRLHITEVELIEVLCRAEITPHPRADQYLPFRIRFEKLLASGRKAATSVFDPKETSALGYSGQAHALTDALAFGKIGWIISPGSLDRD